MDEPMSDLHFHAMALMFRFRDLIKPRWKVLEEVRIEPGFRILDYGCGSGGYVPAAAELAESSGKVYALDIHLHAIEMVKDLAFKKNLKNVETILSDCDTDLPASSLDLVLFYDTYHSLSEPDKILKELHRVLKPDGTLSFSDQHLEEEEIVAGITKGGLFRLKEKGKKTYSFEKKIKKEEIE